MKDSKGIRLDNVDFLNREFDGYWIEICTSNNTEHRVCMTILDDEDAVLSDMVLTDEDIDVLIQALESAKDLRIARIENDEPIYKKGE